MERLPRKSELRGLQDKNDAIDLPQFLLGKPINAVAAVDGKSVFGQQKHFTRFVKGYMLLNKKGRGL